MKMIHDLGEGTHKLGRIFLAAIVSVVAGWVSIELSTLMIANGDGKIDVSVLLAVLGAVTGPAAYYIKLKGQGYVSKQDADDKNPVTEKDFEE